MYKQWKSKLCSHYCLLMIWQLKCFPINILLKQMDQMKYCNQWNVQCNLNKTKVMVLKKRAGGLKDRKCSFMYC